jgi:hypothetical protein
MKMSILDDYQDTPRTHDPCSKLAGTTFEDGRASEMGPPTYGSVKT